MKNLSDIHFWCTEGINFYRWPTGPAYHESEDCVNAIVEFVGNRTVRDIGCGYGRLATKFNPEKYVGYDLCAAAVKKGARMFPGYKFVHWNHEHLKPAEATLLISVAKCVSDEDIVEFFSLSCANTDLIVLAEILDVSHPGPPDYSVYPRSLETYTKLLQQQEFTFSCTFTGSHVHLDLPFTVTTWEKR